MSDLTNIEDDKPIANKAQAAVVSKAKKTAAEQGSVGQGVGGGRPSSFTPELGDYICAQLAEGRSLRRVLKEDGMPAMSTIFRWLIDDDKQKFQEQYTRAKAESADALADEIIDLAHSVRNGSVDPQSARVAGDLMKWSASKLKPKVYGDKLDLTTGNEKLNRGMSDAELNAILERAGSAAHQASTSTKA